MPLLLFLCLLALVAGPSAARPASAADGELCGAAIQAVERAAALPDGLLQAVAHAESGRRDPERRRAVAWPWTVNNAGDGRFFASKAEAMAHVEALRRDGRRNIDVGCMQINLMHHPDAFPDLEAAFDPETNVAYGADFLRRLERETGSWARAVERYHTADPARGQAYRDRVYDRWQDVRLAQAMPPASEPRLEPAAGPAAAAGSSAGPVAPSSRRVMASLSGSGRGFLSLSNRGSRVAVLRPPAKGAAKGYVRTDGRIAGSLLRVGPRRSGLAALPERSRPPATLRRLEPRRPG